MKFVFDLDGTICFKGKPIANVIAEAILALQHEGHEAVFASARPIRDMLPVLDKRFHHAYLIGGNGALSSKTGKIVHTHSFTDEQKKTILHLIKKYNATYLIDSEWDYAYTGPATHPILNQVDELKLAKVVTIEEMASFVKILIVEADDMDSMARELEAEDVVVHKHANEKLIDISPANIHKWSALQRIPLSPEEYVAFGNDTNDMTMFQNAAYAVRIGSHPDLEPYADETIPAEGDVEMAIAQKIAELSKRFKTLASQT
ncbi:Cof-type HAD-IIB family hydrolase [Bacillus inaquosorum]|uniref:HAD-IIB family hydrolase n=1 Tax=Bacillus inaquosorum TaxID=483913 RepID=UPI003F13C692